LFLTVKSALLFKACATVHHAGALKQDAQSPSLATNTIFWLTCWQTWRMRQETENRSGYQLFKTPTISPTLLLQQCYFVFP